MTAQHPPFKLAVPSWTTVSRMTSPQGKDCCQGPASFDPAKTVRRTKLSQLHPHFHCSVIGTCLRTDELRKIMSRFINVSGMTDLEVHHESVSLAAEDGVVARSLHKTLDQRHQAMLQKFSRVRDAEKLADLWNAALQEGEVPGAYWALLTHRNTTPELRQKAFGEVHMLSHLVGASNRADIRRTVELERTNTELKEILAQQQKRQHTLVTERDQMIMRLQQELSDAKGQLDNANAQLKALSISTRPEDKDLVTIQTSRREKAEQLAAKTQREAQQLRDDLIALQRHVRAMDVELQAAEGQLRDLMQDDATRQVSDLKKELSGKRLLYVGGRPSSTSAIRNLVLRHGGDFQKHDGGLEDRKGLLEAAIASSDLVVFPVDCIDHDSAGKLKRLCTRQGTPYVPMRRASIASFATAILGMGYHKTRPQADATLHDPQTVSDQAARYFVDQAMGEFIEGAIPRLTSASRRSPTQS